MSHKMKKGKGIHWLHLPSNTIDTWSLWQFNLRFMDAYNNSRCSLNTTTIIKIEWIDTSCRWRVNKGFFHFISEFALHKTAAFLLTVPSMRDLNFWKRLLRVKCDTAEFALNKMFNSSIWNHTPKALGLWVKLQLKTLQKQLLTLITSLIDS